MRKVLIIDENAAPRLMLENKFSGQCVLTLTLNHALVLSGLDNFILGQCSINPLGKVVSKVTLL
jgi:hypothetical protein